jgi:hypothetical protein
MFPTQADYHFYASRNKPAWYKGRTGLAIPTPDEIVNAHAGLRIPNSLHNTLSLFRLWQSNRIREGRSHAAIDFMRYIVASGSPNQERRFHYCKRALRKWAKNVKIDLTA